MALAHEVAFEVNLIEDDGGLAGWAPVGTRTALSAHAERDTAMLISGAVSAAEPNERIRRSSGRYIVASRRADEEDGLRRAVPAARSCHGSRTVSSGGSACRARATGGTMRCASASAWTATAATTSAAAG